MSKDDEDTGTPARSGFREFFFGKKETLAQDVAQGMITSIFAGLVVATVAALLARHVEGMLERSEQRAALGAMRTATLDAALAEMGREYIDLACARDIDLLDTADCKTRLDGLVRLVGARRDLLAALIPDKDFREMEELVAAARRLQDVRGEADLFDRGEAEMQAFSTQFAKTVEAIARTYD